MEASKPPWRVTASRYVVDTRHLRLREDTIELPDGTIVEGYFVRESRGFVVIFALTPDNRVVLVRQYKHGIGRVVLELPHTPGLRLLDASRYRSRFTQEDLGHSDPAPPRAGL